MEQPVMIKEIVFIMRQHAYEVVFTNGAHLYLEANILNETISKLYDLLGSVKDHKVIDFDMVVTKTKPHSEILKEIQEFEENEENHGPL